MARSIKRGPLPRIRKNKAAMPHFKGYAKPLSVPKKVHRQVNHKSRDHHVPKIAAAGRARSRWPAACRQRPRSAPRSMHERRSGETPARKAGGEFVQTMPVERHEQLLRPMRERASSDRDPQGEPAEIG